ARPTAIAGVVLNDTGPVIEAKGLMRLKSYIGKLPTPRDYDEGADILRRLFDAQFPKFTSSDWVGFAERTWKRSNGGLVPDYDVHLAKTMAGGGVRRARSPPWEPV